jgi:hypothetical protein
VLKKVSASTALVIAAAAGAPLTSPPAYAHANVLRGWHGHHHHHSSRSHHRNRNWNGNRHHRRVFIRIYIYNKNNNHAVALARPERGDDRPTVVRRHDRPEWGRRYADPAPVLSETGTAGTAPVTGAETVGGSPTD